MSRGARRALIPLLALGGLVAVGFAGYSLFATPTGVPMSSHRSVIAQMQPMLGPAGAELLSDGVKVAQWAPDPNYKAQSYYAWRGQTELEFRGVVAALGFEARALPAVEQAVWRLPEGVSLLGWDPVPAPGTAGLQASGTVNRAAAWLRWHGERTYLVLEPGSR